MNDGSFHVRTMRPEEVPLAIEWAAAEGWNPGLADATCFAAALPGGFLLGELADAPAATFSVVNYDERFSFVGFYIVRPDLRGRGFGLNIWQAGIARAGSRAIGLDGVVAQQDNYRKSGFAFGYNNIRYGGWVAAFDAAPATVSLTEVPFDLIAAALKSEHVHEQATACNEDDSSGTKRTSNCRLPMSAFGGKADIRSTWRD